MNAVVQPAEELDDLALGRVADEVNKCLDAGRAPDVEALVAKYPTQATQIRELVPALMVLNQLGQKSDPASLRAAHPVQERPAIVGGHSAAVDADSLGQLGDYRIIRELGRGGMGVVYEADQISLSRHVALKVLPFAAVLDDKQLQRFRNEAQVAAHLHHQNIVPVYSVGCERGVHYYAMQLIEGQTLAQVIQDLRKLAGRSDRKGESSEGLHDPGRAPSGASGSAMQGLARELVSGRLAPVQDTPGSDLQPMAYQPSTSQAGAALGAGPQSGLPSAWSEDARRAASADKTAVSSDPSTSTIAALSTELSTKSTGFYRAAANLCVQAAEALEHAHSLGVMHRDIKPSNLLVDHRGNLWITDFGLAHFQSDSGLTMTGDLVGTIRYMSPEQAMAQRVLVDHRTDIYSLGVTLYELLTLEPAFTGQDRHELLRQIAFEEPRPPRRIDNRMPRELETIVLKAVAKNPAERYATAQELADDLERFLKDEPIHAKRPTLVQRAQRLARQHKPEVATAVVGLIAASVLVAVVATVGYMRTSAALEREEAARREAHRERDEAQAARASEAEQREQAEERRQEAETHRAAAVQSETKAKKSAAIAEAINNFLIHDMLEQANPDVNPGGDKLSVHEVLDRASRKIDTTAAFADEPEVEAAIRHAIGDAFNELGSGPEAEKQLRRALQLRRRELGEDDPDTVLTMNRLAWALVNNNSMDQAATLAAKTAELSRKVLGEKDPETIYALDTLANVWWMQGKLEEAESLERQNLDTAIEVPRQGA